MMFHSSREYLVKGHSSQKLLKIEKRRWEKKNEQFEKGLFSDYPMRFNKAVVPPALPLGGWL